MAERTDLTGMTLELDHKYRVGGVVHRGPMATMYEGKWELFDSPVHVRSYEDLVKLRLRHRDTTRIRWAIESEAGKIRGPGLPDVIDAGIEDPTKPFLIMRLPPGELLSTHLRSREGLSTEKAVTIVHQVARALDHCRELGMPHRGPTADRIWLGADGEVLLLGLGEVLYRDDTVSMAGAPSTELLWHIPPESFMVSLRRNEGSDQTTALRLRSRNRGTLQGRTLEDDPRAEVYALGCLAYHVLNGHHPFFTSPDDPTEGIHATIRDTPLDLRGHGTQSNIWRIVSQAMAREPSERFANPIEFAEAFADAAGLRSPTAVEPLIQNRAQSAIAATTPVGDEDNFLVPAAPAGGDAFQLWAWRFTSTVLFGIVLFFMLQPRLEPRTLLITSDPPQLHFGEEVGHARVDLGTTPIVLRDRPVTAPLRLFVIGPDGYGATTEFDVSEFSDLGHCSSITVPLTYPEMIVDSTGAHDPLEALFDSEGSDGDATE